MQNVERCVFHGVEDDAVVRLAPLGVIGFRQKLRLCVGNSEEDAGSSGGNGLTGVIGFGASDYIEGICERFGIFLPQTLDFGGSGELLRNIPLIENGLDKISFGSEAFANEFERANLGRERILVDREFEPFTGGLGIRKVAHHFDEVSVKLAMKRDGGARVTRGPFLLETEVTPEAEGRAIGGTLAVERAVHTFFRGEVGSGCYGCENSG